MLLSDQSSLAVFNDVSDELTTNFQKQERKQTGYWSGVLA